MTNDSSTTTPSGKVMNGDMSPGGQPEVHWTFLFLSDNWKPLLKCTGVGILLFTLLAFLIPARYQAIARLMPPDQSGSTSALMSALMANGGELLATLSGGALGTGTSGATVVGVLNSRTVQDDIIKQFDLKSVYGKKRTEDARRVLQNRTSIGEDRRSGIITIAVQDRSPQRAAKLAQAYVDEVNSRVANLTTSAAHRERVFLEERLGKVKQQLDDATLRLSQFSSKNKTLDPQIQGKAMLDAASALQGQLIAAETELSGLQQIYGAENVRVKAASARVGELRAKLKTMSGDGNADGAKSSGAQLYPSLEQLPLLGNTYYELARQAKIEEALYEVLIKQYELAKVEEAKELPSIKVLDQPVVPERRSFPPRVLIIVGGTILTFVCAGAWLFARQVWLKLDAKDPVKVGVRELLASFSGRREAPARGVHP
jgi:capsule polysaccharide export protein KpsE/RkpR